MKKLPSAEKLNDTVFRLKHENRALRHQLQQIQPVLQIKRIKPEARLPEYKTAGATCFDLASLEDKLLEPGEIWAFGTGLAASPPPGYGLKIYPRSSIGIKRVVPANLTGIIDQDYRGELIVVLVNDGSEPYQVTAGDRIAQCELQKVDQAIIREVDELDTTGRGDKGFGGTGK